MTDFRALCANLLAQCDAGEMAFAEAIDDIRAALAQPEPQGPTASDVTELFYRHMGEGSEVGFENAIAEALTRWGRPAIEPVPRQEDVHYAWELHDAEGEWQAGGSANSLEDVQREGNRYLQSYSQDGPHKLIIERHCVTTVEPAPPQEVN
jgi:hypothetical protein